jgi:hypothetical protein
MSAGQIVRRTEYENTYYQKTVLDVANCQVFSRHWVANPRHQHYHHIHIYTALLLVASLPWSEKDVSYVVLSCNFSSFGKLKIDDFSTIIRMDGKFWLNKIYHFPTKKLPPSYKYIKYINIKKENSLGSIYGIFITWT